MRTYILIFIISITTLPACFCQTESEAVSAASKVKVFAPEFDLANLSGEKRFIQLGFLGNDNDISTMLGYMDRFSVNDNDMINNIEPTVSEEEIDYYKFYLNPLYDANNFQQLLVMFKLKTFNIGSNEYPIDEFSNRIYAWIKANSKR